MKVISEKPSTVFEIEFGQDEAAKAWQYLDEKYGPGTYTIQYTGPSQSKSACNVMRGYAYTVAKKETQVMPNQPDDFELLKKTFNDIGLDFEQETSETIREETEITRESVKYNQQIIIRHGAGYFGLGCVFYFIDGKMSGHAVWD